MDLSNLSNEELQAEIERRAKKKSKHECIQDVLNHLHQSEVSLNSEIKFIHKVDYSDLEEYLTLVSGKTVEIPAILECGNDSVHIFNASPDKPNDKYGILDFEKAESFLFGDLE